MQCRICWEHHHPLYMSPCLCKGTLKYIHAECFNKTLKTSKSCKCCGYLYHYQYPHPLILVGVLIGSGSFLAWILSPLSLAFSLGVTSLFLFLKTKHLYETQPFSCFPCSLTVFQALILAAFMTGSHQPVCQYVLGVVIPSVIITYLARVKRLKLIPV